MHANLEHELELEGRFILGLQENSRGVLWLLDAWRIYFMFTRIRIVLYPQRVLRKDLMYCSDGFQWSKTGRELSEIRINN